MTAMKYNSLTQLFIIACVRNFYRAMAKELTDLLLENYGKTILRKKENHNFIEWIPTTLNDTYLEHILEFPEEYALPFINYKETVYETESN